MNPPFPVNTRFTLAQADAICRIARLSGYANMVKNARIFILTGPEMVAFLDRNRDVWDKKPEAA